MAGLGRNHGRALQPATGNGAGDAGYPAHAIGLMSGTSADGIDGVLLSLKLAGEIAIEASINAAFPADVGAQINAVIARPTVDLDQLGRLNTQLGRLYAQAAKQLLEKTRATVAVIGCHGQTIRHQPDGEWPFTLQLGGGAIIAHLTGIPTVTDFRGADMAAGGQGAPLAPAFHQAIFSSQDESRALINLGGIANLTHLPAGRRQPVAGFDTGPANTLLDGWCQRRFGQPFDRHGEQAAAGVVHPQLLAHLLADAYFARPPPKSTGREYFNHAWLSAALARHGALETISPMDVLATLTALTAESVARQLNRLRPAVEAAFACGGGVRNQTLMRMLAERCRCRITTTAELGIDPQHVEAAAFAWMAHKTRHRVTATLPSVTGATRPTIAGAIYWPR